MWRALIPGLAGGSLPDLLDGRSACARAAQGRIGKSSAAPLKLTGINCCILESWNLGMNKASRGAPKPDNLLEERAQNGKNSALFKGRLMTPGRNSCEA
jgi:hypothetical protein